jgi:hypothetical protein
LYAVWIRIDGTLPWIELKGTYHTRKEAKKAAEEILQCARTKIVDTSEKRRTIKALEPLNTTH